MNRASAGKVACATKMSCARTRATGTPPPPPHTATHTHTNTKNIFALIAHISHCNSHCTQCDTKRHYDILHRLSLAKPHRLSASLCVCMRVRVGVNMLVLEMQKKNVPGQKPISTNWTISHTSKVSVRETNTSHIKIPSTESALHTTRAMRNATVVQQ